jgi:hypothetical protein
MRDDCRLAYSPVNRPIRRLTALLAATLLLLSGAGDAFGAHPCPHHAAIGAPGHATAETGGGLHADAHHAAAAHDAAPADAGHDGHDACTCGGVCPVSTGPAPLAAPALVALPLLPAVTASAVPTQPAELPSRHLPHLLPFAQAPPRSA